MDKEQINIEYKKIMINIPEVYKVKYQAKVVTQIQVLAILKIFIDKDERREGLYKLN
jgi:hypothetical protein